MWPAQAHYYKEDVWAAMASGTGFVEAISRCAWPTQITIAPP
jgi:hypothetical protein